MIDDRRDDRSRTRVLHVINGMQLGGAEALLYRLVDRPSAFDHEVIALRGRDWYSDRFEQLGIPLQHLGMDTLAAAPKAALRLNALIRRSSADVVQTWMYRSNLLGGLSARRAGIPVVWSIHSSGQHLGPASSLVVRAGGLLARWVPETVINCSARSAALHAPLGYRRAETRVIHNGYDPDVFAPDDASRNKLRQSLGVDPNTFLIGTISRWNFLKDIPGLLEAVRLGADSGVPLHCLLIGAGLGPDNLELARLIVSSGCRDLVSPLGGRPDVPELARAIDLHVLASKSEAFPNVVAETMLSGTPNAVTDVGDAAMMVGATGWVVPPQDPRQLALAIEAAFGEWRAEPEAWRRRRADARQAIADRFTFEQMAEAYENIWATVARPRR